MLIRITFDKTREILVSFTYRKHCKILYIQTLLQSIIIHLTIKILRKMNEYGTDNEYVTCVSLLDTI